MRRGVSAHFSVYHIFIYHIDIHLLIEIPLVNKKFEIDQKTEWLQWSDTCQY
jgi:hypothetical protein